MASVGIKPEPFDGRTTIGLDGVVRSVDSRKSAYVLPKGAYRPKTRRIWEDHTDGTEYIVIRKDSKAALMPVKPVYDANGDVCMYEMVCVGNVAM